MPNKYNTGGRLFIFIWRLLRVFRAYFSLLESTPWAIFFRNSWVDIRGSISHDSGKQRGQF
jgi:hypothetical protein